MAEEEIKEFLKKKKIHYKLEDSLLVFDKKDFEKISKELEKINKSYYCAKYQIQSELDKYLFKVF